MSSTYIRVKFRLVAEREKPLPTPKALQKPGAPPEVLHDRPGPQHQHAFYANTDSTGSTGYKKVLGQAQALARALEASDDFEDVQLTQDSTDEEELEFALEKKP